MANRRNVQSAILYAQSSIRNPLSAIRSLPVLQFWCLISAFALLAGPLGCVRRTISITTEPPSALVFLNDQEIGRSEVTTDFLWYGDYDLVIRKEGYETLQTHWEVKPPWYQIIPLDFFAEVLWPGHLHDAHSRHFVLDQRELPTSEEVTERALEMRQQALDPHR